MRTPFRLLVAAVSSASLSAASAPLAAQPAPAKSLYERIGG